MLHLNCVQMEFIKYYQNGFKCKILFWASDHKIQLHETSAMARNQHLAALCLLWYLNRVVLVFALLSHQKDSLRFVFKEPSSSRDVPNFSLTCISVSEIEFERVAFVLHCPHLIPYSCFKLILQ